MVLQEGLSSLGSSYISFFYQYTVNCSASCHLGFLTTSCSFKILVSVSSVTVACLKSSHLEAKCMNTIYKVTKFQFFIKILRFTVRLSRQIKYNFDIDHVALQLSH